MHASPSPGGEGRGGRFRKPIFGVGGGYWREKHFRLRDAPKRRFGATAVRLVTSAPTTLATITELTLESLRTATVARPNGFQTSGFAASHSERHLPAHHGPPPRGAALYPQVDSLNTAGSWPQSARFK